MIEKRFTVLHDDNGSFVDKSFLAHDFATSAFTFVPVAAEDKLYVGLYKFFTSFYVELGTVCNEVVNTITAEYYDKDDGWTALTIVDETKGFTTSGFISWDRPKDSNFNELAGTVEIDSKTLFFVRFTFSADHTASSTIQGLAPLFSNDADLEEERSNIASSAMLGSLSSWVLKHQATRKQIVQLLRNKGNVKFRVKQDDSSGTSETYNNVFSDITEFDLIEFNSIRQAAKYLTLSKIFHQELSDKVDDKYSALGEHFYKLFQESFATFLLKLDIDDDGVDDDIDDSSVAIRDILLVRD